MEVLLNDLEEMIWRSVHSGELDIAPPEISVDGGQALQLRVLDRWIKQGESLAGFKIGLTSGEARDAFGAGIRPFGFILQSRVLASGDRVQRSQIGRMGIENELVFRVGESISGTGITADTAREAIEAVAPAFEINQRRLLSIPGGHVSNGIRVADNLSQWGIVTGDFVDLDQDFENLVVSLSHNDELVQEVSAKGHIDDHFTSIAALINGLHDYERGLSTGDLIITGSFTKQPIDSPGRWCGNFGEIGQVALEVG